MSVTSNVETNAVLSLYSGRLAKGQQHIRLNKGKNQFIFEDVCEEGTIAVIGPKRMDYQRIVGLLNYVNDAIDNRKGE